MNTVIIHMERYLAHFLHGKKKRMVVDGQHIKEQARLFYATCLKNVRNPPKKPFKASNGWLLKLYNNNNNA